MEALKVESHGGVVVSSSSEGKTPKSVLETEVSPSDVVCAINPETTPNSAALNSNLIPNPWGAPSGGFQPTRAPNVSALGCLGLPGADRTGGMPDIS
ncbi:hypothetical protein Lser_V15G30144 [Lactuca serriola]